MNSLTHDLSSQGSTTNTNIRHFELWCIWFGERERHQLVFHHQQERVTIMSKWLSIHVTRLEWMHRLILSLPPMRQIELEILQGQLHWPSQPNTGKGNIFKLVVCRNNNSGICCLLPNILWSFASYSKPKNWS